MPTAKTIRLLATFYSSFLLASLLIDAACVALYWKNGVSMFNSLFWLKVITLALTARFIHHRKAKEYFYYQNLGVSKVLLWSSTLLFDFALFLLLIIQTHQLR